MKRIKDEWYFTYSTLNTHQHKIAVKCPKCGGKGFVHADYWQEVETKDTHFHCTHCGDKKTGTLYHQNYSVKAFCKNCERHYRVELKDKEKQHFKVLNVPCPSCNTLNSDKVQMKKHDYYSFGEIEKGKEPFFGLELWYLTSLGKGKEMWALSAEHLDYLIAYISADLREKPSYTVMKTQSDHLPTFMKTAKNRDSVLKALEKMRD